MGGGVLVVALLDVHPVRVASTQAAKAKAKRMVSPQTARERGALHLLPSDSQLSFRFLSRRLRRECGNCNSISGGWPTHPFTDHPSLSKKTNVCPIPRGQFYRDEWAAKSCSPLRLDLDHPADAGCVMVETAPLVLSGRRRVARSSIHHHSLGKEANVCPIHRSFIAMSGPRSLAGGRVAQVSECQRLYKNLDGGWPASWAAGTWTDPACPSLDGL